MLYHVTDRMQVARGSILGLIRRSIKLGIDYIQIREKDLPDKALFDLVRRAVNLAGETNCKILVNGRADVALAAQASGVHLPADGIRAEQIKAELPDGFLVGVSVHSIREAKRAESQKVDYVILGPVFSTPSKVNYGAPLGVAYLKKACRAVSIPVFAIGGMNPDQYPRMLESGAAGMAGIRMFQQMKMPPNDFF